MQKPAGAQGEGKGQGQGLKQEVLETAAKMRLGDLSVPTVSARPPGPSEYDAVTSPDCSPLSTRRDDQAVILSSAFGEWPSLHGQLLPGCNPKSVANARWNSSQVEMSLIRYSIATVPVAGARGDIFPLPTTLSAEDEVLVRAAEKGDSEALKEKTSRKAGHVI